MQFGFPATDYLTSIGFRFTSSQTVPALPAGYSYETLLSRHHRIACREAVGADAYGAIFEGVVQQLIMGRFRYDVLQRVQIEDEGTGGDYDLLAFSAPHLLYLECKTGRNIGFSEIFTRHEFLRPALTLILCDVSKGRLTEIVSSEVQPILTRHAKDKDPHLAAKDDYTFPVELISDPSASFALYHTFRNIYLTSGEDLERSLTRTLRHFHQVVQQTSYWG